MQQKNKTNTVPNLTTNPNLNPTIDEAGKQKADQILPNLSQSGSVPGIGCMPSITIQGTALDYWWGRQNIVFLYATRIILHNFSGIAVNTLLVGYW